MRGDFMISGYLVALLLLLPSASANEPPLLEVDDMVYIEGGEFIAGSSNAEVTEIIRLFGKRDMYKHYPFRDEVPKKTIKLKPFFIDRHEVTNSQYADFIDATRHHPPPHWRHRMYPSGKANYPVLYVSYEDAKAYAKWAGKRLPTALEWEKAARGTDGRTFPWGNKFDPMKSATADSDLRLILGGVCSFNSANMVELAPGDISPYGVRDMAGNVREWTSTPSAKDSDAMAVKGASWVDLYVNARAAHTEYIPKSAKSHIIGFRCVKDFI